jgi:peptidyl-tRNA hydrolase, PTH2 family
MECKFKSCVGHQTSKEAEMLMKISGYLPMFLLRRLMKKYDGKLKQILVLRTDLKMRRGKEIAQGSHASMAGYLAHRRNPFMRMWLDGQFAKIAVGIDGEQALLDLHAAAKAVEVPATLIQDAGRTEFGGVPTYTAVSIGPGEPEKIKELTGHLKLR